MEYKCIFKAKYDQECKHSKKLIQNKDQSRINSIISASSIYGDDKYNYLVGQLDQNPELKIYYHKSCVSRYTSLSNLAIYKRNASNDVEPEKKKLRRCHGSF